MAHFSIHSRDYLNRAKQQLQFGTPDALFYAALELRCGIEARMRQYLEPHTHVPKAFKKGYQPAKLDKSLQEAFGGGHHIARLVILDPATKNRRATYYYTPVTTELSHISERLGDYLHAQRRVRSADDQWWSDFSTLLRLGCSFLEDANFGRMLGPPLVDHDTGACCVVVEVDSEDGPAAALETIGKPGERIEFEVTYFNSLADARGDAA